MKSISPLALFALCAVMAAPVMAIEDQPGLTGCAAKQQSITAQIEQARLHGNAEQQAGLERALSEVQAHCTDAGLRKEREQKVLDARHEVAQRKKDLDKAMKKGDAEKINKRKDKLAEANRELQAAVEELEKQAGLQGPIAGKPAPTVTACTAGPVGAGLPAMRPSETKGINGS